MHTYNIYYYIHVCTLYVHCTILIINVCMFVCTGLQNQRECIINEQLLIRDDIQRVAAELEILNNEIETHIARNTICLRRTTLSKRKK